MSKKTLPPSFFILGVQKGGTSSLHKYLSESEDLFFPQKKELHYFDAYFKNGMSWYLNNFKLAENSKLKYSGEATPYYIFHPYIAKRIHSSFPDSKFIILFRNPIDRAFSHYQMSVRRGLEKRTFEDAIKDESWCIFKQRVRMVFNKGFNLKHAEKSYISRGLYYKQLKRWLGYFPKENFLFLKSENLFSNPQPEINKVCEFLKISKFEIKDYELVNQGNYADQIKEETKNRLEKFFANDTKKLEKITNMKFKWYNCNP
jgi:hypothetical protein